MGQMKDLSVELIDLPDDLSARSRGGRREREEDEQGHDRPRGHATGGIAAEIAAILNEEAFEHLDGPIVRLTAPDTPVPSAPAMEDAFLPSVGDIVAAARKLAAY
jgi:hypothetical protein